MADHMAGRVLNGRYEIQGILGGGGMALVYRARDRVLNRTVAVKVLRDQYAGDPLFQQRFTREAQAAGALSHPNIVSVYDVGQDGGLPYIVMEYVPGNTLRDLIEQKGPLPVAQAIEIGSGILAALEYAHRNGLIHRDIKPSNVLITPQGMIKVVDFGIAKGVGDLSLTSAGTALGTAAYLSPEQARGEGALVQSDLYAAGVTLYEMLTCRTPFESDSDVGLAYKHINEAPPSLRQFNPAVPPQLETIILRALAKNPQARFGSAAEMEAALRNYAAFGAQRTAAVPMVPPPVTTVRPAPAPVPVPPRPAPARVEIYRGSGNSSALTWVLGGVALLLLLGGALVVLNGMGQLGAGSATATPDRSIFVPPTTRPTGVLPTLTPPPEPTLTLPPSATAAPSATPAPSATVAPSATALPSATPVVLALVPDLTSRTLVDARNAIQPLKLQIVVTREENDLNHPVDTIISQDPAPGTQISPGGVINVVISKGPAQMDMPGVVNTDGQQAQQFLAGDAFHFHVTVQSEPSSTVPPGVVTRQEPGAGQPVLMGASVTIWISVGPPVVPTEPPTAEPPTSKPSPTPPPAPTDATATPAASGLVRVPNVIGALPDPARTQVATVGLIAQVVNVRRDQISDLPKHVKPGQVARSVPSVGSPAAPGSTVTLAVLADK